MIMVFTEEEKNKLITLGGKFVCEQKIKDKVGYLFKDMPKIKFEDNNINYIKTNKMSL